MDPLFIVIISVLCGACGYFWGYRNAIRYCTERLKELHQ